MPVHKLVLHPSDPAAAPGNDREIAAILAGIGLIGDAFALDGHRHYLPGDNFLSLVTFLGCSPAIELAPSASDALADTARAGQFCHVRIDPPLPAPRLYVSASGRARCPACGKTSTPFPDGYLGTGTVHVNCPHCRTGHAATRFDWRRFAGTARQFIEIWGIYPSEALPGDRLLDSLAVLTRCPWNWFYTTS